MNRPTDPIAIILANQIEHLEAEVAELKKELEEFKGIQIEINRNTAMTQELLDLFQSVRGGFKVLGWLGNLAKWVGGLAAGCYGIYTYWLKVTGK